MKTLLLAYSSKSKGAKRFAKSLGIKRILRDSEESSFNSNDGDLVINWGNSSMNTPPHCKNIDMWVNAPINVDKSVDKQVAFELLEAAEIPVPNWTTDIEEAKDWLQDPLNKVVVRYDKRGMRGRNMAILNIKEAIPKAPLYTNFFFHEAEIRIHVAFDKVIEFHDKTAAGFEGSHSGEKYLITDEQQAMLSSIAVKSIKALNLDFGAVDILWDAVDQLCVVLEVNTAPEMLNGTLDAYTRAFKANFNL